MSSVWPFILTCRLPFSAGSDRLVCRSEHMCALQISSSCIEDFQKLLRSRCGQPITEGADMGWSRRRASQDGTVRFTAYYRDLRGRTCCAGTFPTERRADQAWQRQE